MGVDGNTIGQCYSTNTIRGEANSLNLGGLVGLHLNGTIHDCYSTGAVTDENSSAGLGGLVGWNLGGIIADCYSTGTVSHSSSSIGGLVGNVNGGFIVSCYFLAGSGPDNGFGTSLTDSQMKQQATFSNSGWIFPYIWRIREGVSFPKLPYRIGTVSNLLTMANTADYNEYFVLTADINLAASGTFTTAVIAPDTNSTGIGFEGTAFMGVFDGDGHTISNLTIDTGGAGNDYLGLFGDINNGEIKNLGLENISITGGNKSYCLGGLVGFNSGGTNISNCCSTGAVTGGDSSFGLGGLTGENDSNISDSYSTCAVMGGAGLYGVGGLAGENYGNGNISNCHSTGDVTSGNHSDNVGGLVGYNTSGPNISDCYSTGTVSTGSSTHNVGGMVGYNVDGNISNCYSTGAVTSGTDSYAIGGLAGDNGGSGTIINCYSMGAVRNGNNSGYLGGLVGFNSSGTNISNCCSTGAVTGGDSSFGLGGLVGWTNSGNISASCSTGTVTGGNNAMRLGGLVGENFSSISNCFSTGSISGLNTSIVGGLVGDSNHGNITNCYSTGAVPGSANNGNLVGFKYSGSTISNCYYLLNKGGVIYNSYGSPLTAAQMKHKSSFVGGWDFNDIWWINEGVSYPKLYWQIDVAKCSVTAGSKPNTDKISFSGTMGAAAGDFNDANAIEVTVCSDDLVLPCDHNFPIALNTFKKGKYTYSKTIGGVKKSFTYDVKTHKFAFSASNLDLSGLDCPVTVKIDINDFNAIALLDEAIVNGPKTPVPIQLMTEVRNVLRVDKCTVKKGKKLPDTDHLTVSGAFTVEDPTVSMADRISAGLVITLDTKTFTIPAGSLKLGNGKFSCQNVSIAGGTVTATFNFNLCSFTLTIKNTDISTGLGDVDFGVSFAGFDEIVVVTLP